MHGECFGAGELGGRNPSRTTVDPEGNAWTGNRDEAFARGLIGEGCRPFVIGDGSVVKIGLVEEGRCIDRDGEGVNETSTGLGDVRPWSNDGLVDRLGGVSTAEDGSLVATTPVGDSPTGVAIETNRMRDRNHLSPAARGWQGGGGQTPSADPAQNSPEGAVSPRQPWPPHRAERNGQLLTKRQVLGEEALPAQEHGPSRSKDGGEQRAHGRASCPGVTATSTSDWWIE